jgi:SAM-dependent methyltransferase
MGSHLEKIRRAYDLTAEQYAKGIITYGAVPEHIQNMRGYREIVHNPLMGSNAPDIKEYLKPGRDLRFLDAGCCANLANYRLDRWLCTYYGVDISPALIRAMKVFARKNGIAIGGLYNTDLTNMPFGDNFFHIAAAIGVLEYCTLEYSSRALGELQRVLKPGAKMVFDIPNLTHPYVETMFRLEECLGRTNIPKDREQFEDVVQPLFKIERIDDSQVMVKYFVRKER